MTRSLQAIFENGVLRPLEPLPLKEHQQVTLTLSDQEGANGNWLDTAFLESLEQEADDSVELSRVREGLSKISGSMVEDFQRERDDRT
jgi:predicted DNA-binding antitoxin AbrB/MazE fold protein